MIGEISDKVATIKKNEQKTGHRVSESVVGTRRDDDPSNRLLQTDFLRVRNSEMMLKKLFVENHIKFFVTRRTGSE